MTDAVALLAISQLVCLGGLAYLYTQVQKLRQASHRQPRQRMPMPAHESAPPPVRQASTRAAQQAYGPAPAPRPTRPASSVASLLQEAGAGVDVAALARRMNRSEEEVRLMLRRQGVGRS
jgi:hypothetical protein